MKKMKTCSVEGFFDTVVQHPFIITALLCVMVFPLGFAQAENISVEGIVIEALLWILGSSAFVAFCRPSSSEGVNIWLIISPALLSLVFSLMVGADKNHAVMMFVPVLIGLVQLGAVLRHEGKLTADRVVMMMLLLGVVARYCYCLKYSVTEMQHDIGAYSGKEGHLAYINYWYENGLKLPDFDPTTLWQFYHPPLHHLLMALLLRVFTTLGMTREIAEQAVQMLPMIYSSLCMAVCYRFFKLLRLEGAGLVAAMTGVCFYPTFIIWSGACNNDILTTLLMLLSLLWTLKWAQKPTLLRILPIALCVGCAMMSKLSGWMVAPAITLVFLWVFFKHIKKPLPFIGQFAAFLAVCAPLGLWWGVRNLVTFNVPLAYVPDTYMDFMSVRAVPMEQRLFDFNVSQYQYPYQAFTMYSAPYNEYNPMVALWKTSIFDEFFEMRNFTETASAFVLIAAALSLLGVAGLIVMLLKKKSEMDLMTKLFVLTVPVTIVVSYYVFCFQYPYVCTENIRYCIPVIPMLSLGHGILIDFVFGKKEKKDPIRLNRRKKR